MEKEKQMYITLLKNVLIDLHRIGMTEYKPIMYEKTSWRLKALDKFVRGKNLFLCRGIDSTYDKRVEGKDWPVYADSMIGLKRLNNIEHCVNKIIEDNIPGDFIETGVWRGGATIFMKALLKVNNIDNRVVWVADSFEGLPRPSGKYEQDKDDKHYTFWELAIPMEVVQNNFKKYGLLDANVRFLKGWFKDTLPNAQIDKLALVRLDGDMYESTMDGLRALYPKLSSGGFIIIDDWGAVEGCKKAVIDYRTEHGITENIEVIDWGGVYWRKN